MGWTDELYKIYENNCGEPDLLPVSHSTANAQIEITIDEEGNFKGARTVDKSEAETVIPDTGKAKTGITPPPFPLAETLKYIAGDYDLFMPDGQKSNLSFFEAYLGQLKAWKESIYSHKAVKAIYEYISKKTVLSDCIKSGVLQIDAVTGKLLSKQNVGAVDKALVRFAVNYVDIIYESKTWKDKSLHESFIQYNFSNMKSKQLCYALGKELPVIYAHPYQIISRHARAKLISSNDESGFTYRGRFSGKEEAISVSYDFSQKVHNALKWLISKKGMNFDNLTVVVWASQMQELPDIRKNFYDDFDEEFPETDNVPSTGEQYNEVLKKCIFGYENKFNANTKVMLLGLDAATTGRLSIAMYTELVGSEYLRNIETWHKNSAWLRYNVKFGKSVINSFSMYDIAECAFGTEQNGKLERPKMFNDVVLRLIPCITEGRKIPDDILNNLYIKASNPLAYDKDYNHRRILETACGMIRFNSKGAISMAYDKNETDRSYLYGCLLAIADKAESDTFEKGESRPTNAKRYWNAFSSRPYQTWQIIEEHLQPYLDKLGNYRTSYEKRIQEIMNKMDLKEFEDNSKLKPSYLLGYHHYLSYMYTKTTENNEEV
ncbi:MAG: type I-C CRISPR-associated protein Cas8c/Csd1 [Oscillospiraceae bacterium]|nr:type I-C CRISPR-associated protein Cas8c/Csd1 [Oscillospiraceae bacterium]